MHASWASQQSPARTGRRYAGIRWGAGISMAVAATVVATLAVSAQPPPKAVTDTSRYGVPLKERLYPQTSPQEAIRSVLLAVEKGDYVYLTAHLLDPAEVDQRVADRAKLYEAAVEAEMRAQLKRQQQEFVPRDERVPEGDPEAWNALLRRRTQQRAFRDVVRQVQDRLTTDPYTLRQLTKIAVSGNFTVSGDTAQASHSEVTDGRLYFKQVNGRWYVENRRGEVPAAPPGKEGAAPPETRPKD